MNGSRDSSGELGICRDADVSTPVTKHSLDYKNRFGGTSLHPLRKYPNSSESTMKKEANILQKQGQQVPTITLILCKHSRERGLVVLHYIL